ncbi:hypothetical protein GUITHDRAFT_120027 [Guillardia theta CCMP2712]|uniref:NAD(P)-binding domain-containing protein n=2 Tax=Guillardia theta TaxID=55529 RepID=L1ICG1_GUITC|nr:hypothetical protein GUITHDRAFT_120027 [Guillardia theta CCMP2712]EKX33762.1 hypothetical protein GUITHDRAFT_120027 [Guillardia theta CCMP2712]|eukprot:XP_005820742.1 hypothetical protein GUITHDRAFT_120027 [Guillardia theta CCMP2712]
MQRRSFLASAASAGLLLVSAPPRSGAEGLVGTVTVVGADSYVGGDVLRMLLKQKVPVTACVSPTSSISIPGDSKLLTVSKCDLMDEKEVSEVVRNSGTVIYAVEPRFRAPQQEAVDLKEAADRPEGSSMEVTGLSNVAKACLDQDVKKLVVLSSVCGKCRNQQQEQGGGSGGGRCEVCGRIEKGENAVQELYAADKGAARSYVIVRAGQLSFGERRGPREVELNQGLMKNGVISRLDVAEVLVASAMGDKVRDVSFECYYRDTAEPVDIYSSLQSCRSMGKTTRECFFGDAVDNKSPLSLDDVLQMPLQGSLFPTGREVVGLDYSSMLSQLTPDNAVPFDIDSIRYESA